MNFNDLDIQAILGGLGICEYYEPPPSDQATILDGHLYRLPIEVAHQLSIIRTYSLMTKTELTGFTVSHALADAIFALLKRVSTRPFDRRKVPQEASPSAFQIRFGGAKGMTSYLVLEDLGVPKQVFLDLQRDAIRELSLLQSSPEMLVALAGRIGHFGNFARLVQNLQVPFGLTMHLFSLRWIIPPGAYLSPKAPVPAGDVTIKDITDFIVYYLKNNNLGVISKRHMMVADISEGDVFHRDCLMASLAVDFAKTGVAVNLKDAPTCRTRPDYLCGPHQMGHRGIYKSERVIGLMFRDQELNRMLRNTVNHHGGTSTKDPLWSFALRFAPEWRSSRQDGVYDCFVVRSTSH
ncbi:UNVERIFIED_CONTAM: hypothetical protein HDU68_002255 [Siphonaria sp. JEL0065]|nr:hypothetical protein HDU68_002255 [Siphonaria sp. JEL0065]